MRYIVAGIGTDVGKTVVSAILTKALEGDYWKPVQAGCLEATDSMIVQDLLQSADSVCHPEAYKFREPVSPHLAAQLEGIQIDPDGIRLPQTEKPLVIEMSGGLLSPLDGHLTQCDLFSKWDCQWLLVSKHYLGSINHTLLSLDYMKQKKLPLMGIIFNGETNPASEKFILDYAKISCIGRINQEKIINSTTIAKYATEWKEIFLCKV